MLNWGHKRSSGIRALTAAVPGLLLFKVLRTADQEQSFFFD